MLDIEEQLLRGVAAPARRLGLRIQAPDGAGLGLRLGLGLGAGGGLNRPRHGRRSEQDERGRRGGGRESCTTLTRRGEAALDCLFCATNRGGSATSREAARDRFGAVSRRPGCGSPSRNRRRRWRARRAARRRCRRAAPCRRAIVEARDEAGTASSSVDDRDAARIGDRAGGRARGGEAPQAEQEMDDIVIACSPETCRAACPCPGRPCSIAPPSGGLDQLRHEAGDADGEKYDAENQCECPGAHPCSPSSLLF